MNAPLYLARSGGINGGSLNGAGGYSYYWSSTVNNSENVRNLYFNSSNVYPEGNGYRYNGFSLRCVMREFLIVSLKAQPTADQVSASVDILA